MKVYFITTNSKKLDTAKNVLAKYTVDLEMLSLDAEVPEIQDYETAKIAAFSAQYVANLTQKPCIVTDVGYFIRALNSFPGAFIKQINHYLTSEDLLNLIQNKTDRSFEMVESLTFCEPNKEPKIFETKSSGKLALEAVGIGSGIDRIMIRDGMERVQTTYSHEELIDYYAKNLDHWDQFGKYYMENLVK